MTVREGVAPTLTPQGSQSPLDALRRSALEPWHCSIDSVASHREGSRKVINSPLPRNALR